MTRREANAERARKRERMIGNAVIGVCAGMGAIWFFCAFAGWILRLLGVG